MGGRSKEGGERAQMLQKTSPFLFFFPQISRKRKKAKSSVFLCRDNEKKP